MTWSNQNLALYHGTSTASLSMTHFQLSSFNIGSLHTFSVQLARCDPYTDFGRGFYTTTSLDQAKWWANLRAETDSVASGRSARVSAVLLNFDVDREWLADREILTFVVATVAFHDFVDACRVGGGTHRRGGGKNAYDIVHGPVRAGGPKRMIYQNCDQMSFHSQSDCDTLTAHVLDLAANPSDVAAPGLFQIPPP